MSSLRDFLSLSRVAALPTVWSNCLAGWWLGGGGRIERLGFLFAGATCLYVGGAFLNDAFDATYDRQHRRTRPVASGAVEEGSVWWWGLIWLIAGAASLFWVAPEAGALGLALAFWLVVYNALHRYLTFSPVLLGLCRLFLYLVAAAVGHQWMSGWVIWCGLAQAIYVAGSGFPVRRENPENPIRHWPLLLLFTPVVFANMMNANAYREAGFLLSVIVALWTIRSLRSSLWSPVPQNEETRAGLTAGIVFVDWLAVPDIPRHLAFVFIGLFLATILFHRLAQRGMKAS